MSNMSYCRFRNTLGDLRDCHDALCEDPEGDELSSEEKRAQNMLIALCRTIADEFMEE